MRDYLRSTLQRIRYADYLHFNCRNNSNCNVDTAVIAFTTLISIRSQSLRNTNGALVTKFHVSQLHITPTLNKTTEMSNFL